MPAKNLINAIQALIHNAPVAAGQTAVDPSSGVDCSDCEGVLYLVWFGTITATAVTSLKVQQSSDNGVADGYSDVAGSAVTVLDSNDDRLFLVNHHMPQKRYSKLYISRGTANAVVNGVLAIKYGLKTQPATQSTAHVANSKLLIAPAEGTA